jgi:hypothetical protein
MNWSGTWWWKDQWGGGEGRVDEVFKFDARIEFWPEQKIGIRHLLT